MKLVECKADLIQQSNGLEGLYRHIETCGRVPYKSEDNSDGTVECAKAFVEKMIKSSHNAVLEHGTVYLKFFNESETRRYKYLDNPYSRVIAGGEDIEGVYTAVYYVTSNYRVLVENGWLDDLRYICEPAKPHAKRYTFKVITSIGVTREFNRHRALSILEQSTRYCNFSKDKFDYQVSFCKPSWINLNTGVYELHPDSDGITYIAGDGYIKDQECKDPEALFLYNCIRAELAYMELLDNVWIPQQAREVLPLCTATEAVYTGFADQWSHFFDLRYFQKTGKVHPNMLELSTKMKDTAKEADIWDDISSNCVNK